MGRVTIREIAALVQTSPKTVSKALNNQPGVSSELRAKIQETARALNYIPNIFGKGLSGNPLRTIGIVLPENENPIYFFFINGLEMKAAECGYNIILCFSHESLAREQELIQMLLAKHVDGIIINPVAPAQNHNIELLQQLHIPYTLVNRTIPHQDHPCVKADNRLGAYLAGRYLLAKGHRQIVYLTRQDSVSSVEERIAGLTEALAEQQITYPASNIYRRCEVSVASGYAEMRHILDERRDFTAVFTYNDILAFGALKALAECRRRIPADVAVMGFDNMIFADISLVPLTTVNQDFFAIGAVVMGALLQKIHGEQVSPALTVPAPYIVERESA